MRVSELAKELGRSSKEILDILQKRGYDVKTHSSNVNEEQTAAVKKLLVSTKPSDAGQAEASGKPENEKTEFSEKAEAFRREKSASSEPPKKKIVAVYRPQNSQTIKNGKSQSGRDGRSAGQGGSGRQAGGRKQNGSMQQGLRGQSISAQPGSRGQSGAQSQGRSLSGALQTGERGQRGSIQPGSRGQGGAAQSGNRGQNMTAQEGYVQDITAQTEKGPQGLASKSGEHTQTAVPETASPQTAVQADVRSQGVTAQPGGQKDAAAQTVSRESTKQTAQAGGRESGRDSSRAQGQGGKDGNRDSRGQGGRDGNRDNRSQSGRDGNREGRNQGSRDGNRDSRNQGSREGRSQSSAGGRDGNREGRNQGYGAGRDGNRDGRGQGYGGSRDGNREGRSQGYGAGRDGNRDGRGQGYGGNREGRGQSYGGSRDGRSQGYSGSREGRGQSYGGSRDGKSQGYAGSRDGGRDGRGQSQGSRFGQRDSRKSFDTPLAAKPQSSRANKNAYKNDKYDKKNMTEDGPKSRGKSVSNKHPFIMPQKPVEEKVEDTIKVITLPEVLTIKELAEKMKLQPSAIVKKLFMKGTIVTLNQEIDYDKAEEIAMEYDVLCEKEKKVDVIEELLREDEEEEKNMTSRPPVVCVMGHVDHGKTSLLDAIRQTNVTSREAGGITQHIGAYMVEINGQKITFLDTPGHEAFTAMRMRGAQSTDIAVLVVAADDGVMPQTVEAINHAKAAGVEILVAINKIDKPSANVERVKQELAEYELVPEDWGGSTIFVPVSAHTKEGISDLLEMIILAAEVKELKANPNRNARGLVIEAELDKGKGPVATVLVQKGTLRVGDNVAAGACYGKVRAMMDDKGRRVKEAKPSTPVEILGLNGVPNAGEVFVVTANEKESRSFAETFISEGKNKLLEETKAKLSLDDLFSQIQAGNVKELPIIVKADVQGSVEAVKQSLVKLSNEEVLVKVIHGGVGAINESDVTLASASNAIIIGFNVRPDATAKSIAEREKVDIRLYKVIYQAIEDVEAAIKGMLDPVFEEKVIGHAVVRQTFKASGVGTIAGSYVMDGKFQRNCLIRITRNKEQIYEGSLASLKRFKDDVKEVAAGYECGLVFEKFNDIQIDDVVEAYIMVEVPR